LSLNKIFALALLIGWNAALVTYRVSITDKRTFAFFLWNLALAIVPYIASEWALAAERRSNRWLSIGLVLFSVLFLPNSPYIITDFFHLRVRPEVPLWFDTLLFFSMAGGGLLLFYLALFNIAKVLRDLFGRVWAEISVAFLCFLCAFGIYLGRYLRFNSWDVVSNPDNLFYQITDKLTNPSDDTRSLGVTLVYGTFLLVMYWVVRLFGEKEVR
jgi:uncharacterized membrane protein